MEKQKFPEPTPDEYAPGEAVDRRLAIEGEVWDALESGIEGGWVTIDEAEDQFLGWLERYGERS